MKFTIRTADIQEAILKHVAEKYNLPIANVEIAYSTERKNGLELVADLYIDEPAPARKPAAPRKPRKSKAKAEETVQDSSAPAADTVEAANAPVGNLFATA